MSCGFGFAPALRDEVHSAPLQPRIDTSRQGLAAAAPMTRCALLLGLVLGSTLCSAAPLQFERFVASFVLTAFGTTVGRTEWRLVPLDSAQFLWESRSETAGAGALLRDVYITERSESQIHGLSFRPLDYHYDRYGENVTRNIRVRFDWENHIVLNTAKDHTWQMSVPEGTLDKLNYLLALMRDLADGKRSMRYNIADGGRLKVYEMRADGTETLETALGTLKTLRIRRLRDPDYGVATLWCASALGYLPVKLEQRDRDGILVSMQIQSIEGMPPTVIKRPGG
jgi:hypothetical protein